MYNKNICTPGIYKIENTKTHKVYVGSSINIEKRFKQHRAMLAKGQHHSVKLQRSYNATDDKDVFVFSVVETLSDIENLKDREQYYIDLYNSFNNGYNCTEEVDNPKYSFKNQAKKKKASELDLLYDEFFSLYKEGYIVLGRKLIDRITKKHYKNSTMKNLIRAVEWFSRNYSANKYKLKIKFTDKKCWLIICDQDNIPFASYISADKVRYHKEATEYTLNQLKMENKYNEYVHIPIITESFYDKNKQHFY